MTDSMIDFRRDIDFIDRELCRLFEKRLAVAKRMGKFKKERGIPIEDLEREAQMMEDRLAKTNLPESFLRKVFAVILDESKRIQRESK